MKASPVMGRPLCSAGATAFPACATFGACGCVAASGASESGRLHDRLGWVWILALACCLTVPEAWAAPAKPPAGRLWERTTALFRKRPVAPPVPGHLSVAADVARRRGARSPFLPPMGEGGQPAARGAGKPLTPAEGRKLLDQAGEELRRLGEAMETGPWDKLLKSMDAMQGRLAASIFPDRTQRTEAQELDAGLAALRRRAELRAAFARQGPRVSFIVCAPGGKSLAVVNRRVMREGDAIAPGVVLAAIRQHEVIFELEGERIAVGLK